MVDILYKIFKHSAVVFSMTAMILNPVAHGYAAEENLQKYVENFITETQINKKTTYKDFWLRTKHLYPAHIAKDVEKYLMQSADELMPEFTLQEAKTTAGEKIPVLRISENGKSYTIQIFGEKDKFAKFNNVILSENDLKYIDPAVRRIAASDINIKKQYDNVAPTVQFQTYKGTPPINLQMWKSMSAIQRAQFIVTLRYLWQGARDVLDIEEKNQQNNINTLEKPKKTSSLFYHWNNFFGTMSKARAFVPADMAKLENKDCVIAGYIGKYTRTKKDGQDWMTCSYPQQEAFPSTNCQYPCNPIIYGYSGNGGKICLSSRTELQTATHFNSGCDKAMPFSNAQIAPMKADEGPQNSSRYGDGPDKYKKDALDQISWDQNEGKFTEFTEKYLQSILNSKNDRSSIANLFLDDKPLTQTTLDALIKIQKSFDDEIKKARTACAAAADVKVKYDKNFIGACDQLHRRFLFVAEYLQKKPGCPDGSKINASSLMCECPAPGKPVSPGTKTCEVAPPPNPINECRVINSVQLVKNGLGECVCPDTDQEPAKDPMTNQLTCGKIDKKCQVEGTVDDGWGSCVCKKTNKTPVKDKKGILTCDSGFNWKPWLIGAGVVATAGVLWFVLKKKNNSSANAEPVLPMIDPSTCKAPKVINGGICGCPTLNACTPKQQIYNLSTCQCDSVAGPQICPDGFTQYFTPPGSTSCPAPTVCQNGSTVYPPETCPLYDEPTRIKSGVSGAN